MNATGINQGTAGNLSVRTGDGFLITPVIAALRPHAARRLRRDVLRRHLCRQRRPSSEWRFHRDILRQRTDIDVVLHCHSIYATTLACHHKTIPQLPLHDRSGRRHHHPLRQIRHLRHAAAFRRRPRGAWRTASPACSASTARSPSARPWKAPSGWRIEVETLSPHLRPGAHPWRAADPPRRGNGPRDRADAPHELRPSARPRRHQRRGKTPPGKLTTPRRQAPTCRLPAQSADSALFIKTLTYPALPGSAAPPRSSAQSAQASDLPGS